MYQILQKFDIHWHDGGPSIAMMYHLRRVSDLLCNWKSCLLCYMKDVVLHCSIFFKWNKLVRVRVRVRCSGTGKRYSNRKETSCVPLLNAGFEPGVPDTKSPADWMLADKPTELSRIKLKTWTRQPVPMISEHSAHLTPLSVDFRTWLWRYTYLLLLISMLWHRQAIFKSKGDKLCSSAECRIWTRGPRHPIASRLNSRWQTDWAIEDQAKNLNSTARPYDQRAFSPLDPTVSWLSHLALAIHICCF